MDKLLRFTLFLGFICLCGQTYAFENYQVDVISNRQGLPSDKITAMCQDRRGFIWIATQEGLCRYDGYNIKHYKNLELSDTLIFGKEISSLLISKDQTLVIGTRSGLYKFDTFREIFSDYANDMLSSREITSMQEDSVSLWVGTDNGLNRYFYDTGRMSTYKHTSALNGREIRSIRKDPSGGIWVAYKDKGFSRYDPHSNEFIHYPEIKPGLMTFEFIFDSGQVYVGTWGSGLYRVQGEPKKGDVVYEKSNIDMLSSTIIYKVAKDNLYNYYWICTPKGVLVTDDLMNSTFTTFIPSGVKPNELSNEEVGSIFYDKQEKNIWLGTGGGGVNRISLNPLFIRKHNMATIKRLYNSNTVTSIFDRGKELWIGVRSVGFVLYDKQKGEARLYKEDPVLKNISTEINGINTIVHIKSRNEIWLGSRYDGIWIVSLDRNDRPVKVNRLSDICAGATSIWETTTIFEDRDGHIWLGGWDGLRIISKDKKGNLFSEHITSDDNRYSLPYSAVMGIVQSNDGRVWIATGGKGIYAVKLDVNSIEMPVFERIPIQTSVLKYSRISVIFCDSKSQVIIGATGAGLLYYDQQKECFVESNKLLNGTIGTVYSIIEPNNGDMWLGTNNGIFNHKESNGVPELHRYTYNDGLTENVFLPNSVCFSDDNVLYFGGYNGFSSLNLNQNKTHLYSRNVAITDIRCFDESIINTKSKKGSCTSYDDGGHIKEVTISNKDAGITFEFSSLSFNNVKKNRYRYILEGFDSQWIELSYGHNTASYNNLPAGKYTFKVAGSNDSGCWGATPITVSVVVRHPWYSTWWAWCIYLIISSVIVFIIVQLIITRIKLHNKLMISYIDRQKTEELNGAKLQFFTNVSHELLTPLSIISCGMEDLNKSNPQDIFIHKILRGNINRLMRLLEQILEFRKADTGNLQLKVSLGDIAYLINQITTESFLPLIEKKRLKLNVDCKPSQIYGWFDGDKIDKITYNLLSNAFKYNVEQGIVDIYVAGNLSDDGKEYSSVTLRVTNSGEQIDPKQMANIFKRFYDGEYRKFATKGCGIGLALTKDLVELHKGTISVSSTPDQGTTFIVTIPLSRSTYGDSEVDNSSVVVKSSNVLPDANQVYMDGEPLIENIDTDNRPSVLIVEDDVELSVIMRSALSRLYNVYSAQDGAQGLVAARKYNPDIIISDIVMPTMNGYEMCSKLKKDINISHIPVILLTAKIAMEDEVHGLDVGADAYMTKPVQIKLLYAHINSLLNNRKLILERFKQPNMDINLAHISTLDDQFLQKAINVIESNLDNTEFDIKDFINAMNVTNSMLYRKLKSLTALSPNEFIRNIRLKAAYRIIHDKAGRVSISEVAYMVGFNTPKYFAACFKREFGYIPSQLLEQLDDKNDINE